DQAAARLRRRERVVERQRRDVGLHGRREQQDGESGGRAAHARRMKPCHRSHVIPSVSEGSVRVSGAMLAPPAHTDPSLTLGMTWPHPFETPFFADATVIEGGELRAENAAP